MSSKNRNVKGIDLPAPIAGQGGTPTIEVANVLPPAQPNIGAPYELAVIGSDLLRSAATPDARVTLRWRPPVGVVVSRYEVQTARNSAFTVGSIIQPALETSAQVPYLDTGTTYYFRVRAVAGALQSAWSNVVSVTTEEDTTPPDPPTNLTYAWDGVTGDLTLRWNNPSSANFRDVRIEVFATAGGTLLLLDSSTVGRFVLPYSRNRQFAGGVRTSLYIVLTSRSTSGVLSTSLTGTVSISAPNTPTGIQHSWQANPATAAALWRIAWDEVAGAAAYILTINGRRRLITDTQIAYSSGLGGLLVTLMEPRNVVVTFYEYSLTSNAADHGGSPSPVLEWSLQAQNIFEQRSEPISGSAVNTPPPATTITALGVFSTIALQITPSLAQDLKHYRIRVYKDGVLQPNEAFTTLETDVLYAVKAGSGDYEFDVAPVDVFNQPAAVSARTTPQAVTDAREFVAALRSGAQYSMYLPEADPQALWQALADDDRTTGGVPFGASSDWQWVQVIWDYQERFRQITAGRFGMTSGSVSWYLALSEDSVTWRYFASPVTVSGIRGILTEVATEAAARATPLVSTNNTNITRWELPQVVQARFIRLWIRKPDGIVNVREFYPRRLIQGDDVEAESLTGINFAAQSITVDKLLVGDLIGFTLTGGTIRTAESGARLEMTSANGLRSLDASGAELLRLLGGQGLRYNAVDGQNSNRAVTFWASNQERGGLYGYTGPGTTYMDLQSASPSGAVNAWLSLESSNSSGEQGYASYRAITEHTFFNAGNHVRLQLPTNAPVTVRRAQSAATTISELLRIRREADLATNDGADVVIALDTGTTVSETNLNAATIRVIWSDGTHVNRTARLSLHAHDANGMREGMRVQASGGAPLISFYGVGAVARQAVAAVASDAGSTQTLANSLRTILINLGLAQA